MKDSNKNCIILRKSGKFYNAFDEDATILSYFFAYKITAGKIGFPSNSYDKVINLLEEKTINYVVISKDGKIEKNYKNRNKYQKVLEKAIYKENGHKKINLILEKLEKLSSEQLDKIIDIIGREINDI